MNEPDAELLDEGVLDELRESVEGDRGFVVQLIEAYLSDGAEHLDGALAAIQAGDADALVRPAHTLKSSSATLGATRLAATARGLEMTARSGSLDATAAEAGRRLRSEWDATTAALRAWIGREDTA